MNNSPNSRWPSAAVWTAIFTGVLTVCTIAQVLFNRTANELNAASQRAMVNVGGPAWRAQFSQDGKKIVGWRFGYSWTNSGRSPARRVISQVTYSFGDSRPTKELDFDSLSQGPTVQAVIGPNGGLNPQDMLIPLDALKEVAEGKKHLFFWGWVTYDDGIKGSPRRLTEFCNDVTSFEFSIPEDPTDPRNMLNASWPPCSVHFCYDGQCEDYSQRTK